ncbi:MAG: GNAT family N-acetyltransferase [Betaproteobacteria bacterium]|jgi:ribosomal-protein-alanine N-acetyltransferase|nr:GNAT family N-acetyltransferase [Betaproteobacteria bacterium]
MTAAKLTLRLATPADAQAIAVMSRDLIETGLGWSWTPARVARSIANRDTTVLAACDGHLVIGFAIMHFGDDRGRLNLLAVHPRYQGAGLGRRMNLWLEECALVAGIEAIELELRRGNVGARKFYERLGYRSAGVVTRYYRGEEDALRMARDIRRTVGPAPAWQAPWLR